MKNKKVNYVGIVIFIVVILLIIGLALFNKFKDTKKGNIQLWENNENTATSINEEYVQVKKDGTKVNVSNEIKKDKTIDGMKVKNIQLEAKENETIIIATIENSSNQTKGDYGIYVIAKDKDGKELKKVSGYINTVKAKETTILRIKTSYDFANAYDISLEKQ